MTATATLPRTVQTEGPVALGDLVRRCRADGTPIASYGVAHRGVGAPPPAEHVQLVQTAGPNAGIIEHYERDLTVRASAGATIAGLNAVLRKTNQFIPIDTDADLTLGEVIDHHVYGGLRAGYGSIRDQLLGLRFVDGTGREIHVGGRTVKNVAGYDMTRLMVGALGTLGLIYEATLRTYALPEQAMMVDLSLADPAFLDRHLTSLMLADARPGSITLSHVDDAWVVRIRYFGRLTGCVAQLRSLETWIDSLPDAAKNLHILATGHSTLDAVLAEMTARRAWRRDAPALVKLIVPPAASGRVVKSVEDWARENHKLAIVAFPMFGCLFIGGDLDDQLTRALDKSLDKTLGPLGALRVWYARPQGTMDLAPFAPPQPDWAMMAALKNTLDPSHLFNRGRFPGMTLQP